MNVNFVNLSGGDTLTYQGAVAHRVHVICLKPVLSLSYHQLSVHLFHIHFTHVWHATYLHLFLLLLLFHWVNFFLD